MADLRVWRNDVIEWVIATSPEDANLVMLETGSPSPDDPHDWTECPLDEMWQCHESEDPTDLTDLPFRKWVEKKGRSFLGTTEW